MAAISGVQLSVAWDAPSSGLLEFSGDGGDPISRYIIEWAETATGTTTESLWNSFESAYVDGDVFEYLIGSRNPLTGVEDTPLSPNTNYVVRVRARNSIGESDSVVATPNPVTTEDRVPFAPTITSTSSGSDGRSLNVEWTFPANDGGSTVDEFFLEWSLDNETWLNSTHYVIPERQALVTTLPSDYQQSVQAIKVTTEVTNEVRRIRTTVDGVDEIQQFSTHGDVVLPEIQTVTTSAANYTEKQLLQITDNDRKEIQTIHVAASHRDTVQRVTISADNVDEVQQIVWYANLADGYTFQLQFDSTECRLCTVSGTNPYSEDLGTYSFVTSDIVYSSGEDENDLATNVEAALNNLKNIDGGVSVAGTSNNVTGAYSLTVTFDGDTVNGDVPLLEIVPVSDDMTNLVDVNGDGSTTTEEQVEVVVETVGNEISGTFVLSLDATQSYPSVSMSGSSAAITWDATAESDGLGFHNSVQEALEYADPDVFGSVSVELESVDNSTGGHTWLITFTSAVGQVNNMTCASGTDVPLANSNSNASSVTCNVESVDTGNFLGGTFDVSFGGGAPVTLDYDASDTEVQSAVETVTGYSVVVASGRDAYNTANSWSGEYYWAITFASTYGDIPSLDVDGSALTGSGKMVNVTSADGLALQGNYSLELYGAVVDGLDPQFDASQLETALNTGLASVNVTVSVVQEDGGGVEDSLPGKGHSFTIEFVGVQSGLNVPLLSSDGSNLVGENPNIQLSTSRDGTRLKGTFRLVFDGYSTGSIDADANPDEVEAQLEDLVESIGDVSVSRSVANELNSAYTWTVTFDNGAVLDEDSLTWGINAGNIPKLACDSQNLETTTDDDASAHCAVRTIRDGVNPLGGSFTLNFDTSNSSFAHFRVNATTTAISAYASSEEVKAAIESLPNVAEVDVSRDAVNTSTGALTWHVTFLHDENGFSNGNVPQLVADPSRILEGDGAWMSENTEVDGNNLRGQFGFTVTHGYTSNPPEYDSADVMWNATAAEIEAAFDDLGSLFNVTVGDNSWGPVGSYGAFYWDVTFLMIEDHQPYGSGSAGDIELDLTTLIGEDIGGEVTTVVTGSSPLNGTFGISFSGSGATGIDFDVSAVDLEAILNDLDTIGDVSVTREEFGSGWDSENVGNSDREGGYVWWVTFVHNLGTVGSGVTFPPGSGNNTRLDADSSGGVLLGTAAIAYTEIVAQGNHELGGQINITYNGSSVAVTSNGDTSAAVVETALSDLDSIGSVTVSSEEYLHRFIGVATLSSDRVVNMISFVDGEEQIVDGRLGLGDIVRLEPVEASQDGLLLAGSSGDIAVANSASLLDGDAINSTLQDQLDTSFENASFTSVRLLGDVYDFDSSPYVGVPFESRSVFAVASPYEITALFRNTSFEVDAPIDSLLSPSGQYLVYAVSGKMFQVTFDTNLGDIASLSVSDLSMNVGNVAMVVDDYVEGYVPLAATVPDIVPGSPMFVRVAASNENGLGDFSETIQVTPVGLPSSPSTVTVAAAIHIDEVQSVVTGARHVDEVQTIQTTAPVVYEQQAISVFTASRRRLSLGTSFIVITDPDTGLSTNFSALSNESAVEAAFLDDLNLTVNVLRTQLDSDSGIMFTVAFLDGTDHSAMACSSNSADCDVQVTSDANYIGGEFFLLFDGEPTRDIAFNASANEMKTILEEDISSIDAGGIEVTRSGPDAVGGFVWTVTFVKNVEDMAQVVLLESGQDGDGLTGTDVSIIIQEVTAGNSLSGDFTLRLGDEVSDSIAYNADASEMQAAVTALDTTIDVSVAKGAVTSEGGATWMVTFVGDYFTEDIDSMVTDTSNLGGDEAGILVLEQTKGTEASGTKLAVSFSASTADGGDPIEYYKIEWDTSDDFTSENRGELVVDDELFLYAIQTVEIAPPSYTSEDVTGSFALQYGDSVTSMINASASAFEVRTALELLPSVGAVEVERVQTPSMTNISLTLSSDLLQAVNPDGVDLSAILGVGEPLWFGGEQFCVKETDDVDSDGISDNLVAGIVDFASCDGSGDAKHASGDVTEDDLGVWVEGSYSWIVTFVSVEERTMLFVPSIKHIDLSSDATLSVRGQDCVKCVYIEDLQIGQPYYVRVSSGNSAGESSANDMAVVGTPMTIPGSARDVVVASVDAQSIEVQWNRPTSDGGDAISSYIIELDTSHLFDSPTQYYYYPSSSSTTAYDYAYVIAGLSSNTTYHVRVTGVNSVPFQDNENWELTTPSTVTPHDIAPDPASSVSVERLGADRVRVWLVDPTRTGGQPIDAYNVVLSTSSSFDENVIDMTIPLSSSQELVELSGERFYDIEGLSQGEVYYVTAAVVTAAGTSDFTQSAASVLPSRSSDAPTSVSTSTVSEQSTPITAATISWSPPTSDGGASIAGYRVDYWHKSSVSEIQTITVRRATDGFGLEWKGQTTSVEISPNATAAYVRYVLMTDLESTAGLGHVEVSRTAISDGYEWRVTFEGNEGDQPLLQCDAPDTVISGEVVPSCTIAETVRGQSLGGVGEIQTVWIDSSASGYFRLRKPSSVWSTYIAVNATSERVVEALQDLSDVAIVNVELANNSAAFRVEYEPTVGDQDALEIDLEYLECNTDPCGFVVDGSNDLDGTTGVPVCDATVGYDCRVGELPVGYNSTDTAATARSLEVDGFVPGESYSLSVTALNARGYGERGHSATDEYVVIPQQVPGRPEDVALDVTYGDETSLTVSYAAPSSDGGADVLKYKIEWCAYDDDESTSECFTVPLSGNVETESGRTLAASAVRCENFPQLSVYQIVLDDAQLAELGNSSFSLLVDSVETPPLYSNAVAMAADERDSDDNVYCHDEPGCVDDYASIQSVLETLDNVDAVTVSKSTPSSGGVMWTVTFLDDLGRVDVVSNHPNVTVNELVEGQDPFEQCEGSFKILGLTTGQYYAVRVSAYNAIGYGLPQIAESPEKPMSIPDAPTNVVLDVVDEQSLRVAFSPPGHDGGDSITAYMVELDSSADFDTEAAGTLYMGTNFTAEYILPVMYLGGGSPFVATFTGLTLGTRYYARVRAYNSQGFGAVQLSSPASDVPRREPGAPSSVTLHVTSDSELTVAFGEPLDNGGEDISFYKIEWDISPNCNSNAAPPNKGSVVVSADVYDFYTLTDLSPELTYYVLVSAANSMGYGPSTTPSNRASASPALQAPGTPEFTSITYDDAASKVVVSWAAPTVPYHGNPCNGTVESPGLCPSGIADGGETIINYLLEYDVVSSFDSAEATELSIDGNADYALTTYSEDIENLAENVWYFRVVAVNSEGAGKTSDVVSVAVGDATTPSS